MSFLQKIAQYYWDTYGNLTDGLIFVFPNRRAGLFFRKYFADAAKRTVFAPQTITIEQLFQTLSSLTLADPTEQLVRLYEVYREIYARPLNIEESFDEFVFWGRMMLHDFNETDLHLADARKLFSNLSDLKDIDMRFSLSEEDKASIRIFIEGFQNTKDNTFRKRFLTFWRALWPVYHAFRENLRHDGQAYMGMLCREVAEDAERGAISIDGKTFIFIGFNALNGTERMLMRALRDKGCAHFHWDYNSPFLQDANNKASFFREQNLQEFPDSLSYEPLDNFKAAIHLVQIPSYTGLATAAGGILTNLKKESEEEWTRIAVVLPEERMLQPMLAAIPGHISAINVTMGQPLQGTAVYSFIQHLSELQLLHTRQENKILFHYKPVLALLHHPYLSEREQITVLQTRMVQENLTYVPQDAFAQDTLLSSVFKLYVTPAEALQGIRQLLLDCIEERNEEQTEYLYQTLLLTGKLTDLLRTHESLSMQVKTLFSLLLKLMQGVTIPFEGEPLRGLQVMGMLESRGMDFDTILLTNVNDDVLPGNEPPQSFIPYDLRRAYGLPTSEQQDAVAAYNFYRLISHAREVWLLQNTTSDDRQSGEASRYVQQLVYQYNIPIQTHTANALPKMQEHSVLQVDKTDAVLEELRTAFCPSSEEERKHGLSPSALNTYVSCPLRFYLTYVRSFRETKHIEEELGYDHFGTILHETMEELYADKPLPYTVYETDLSAMLDKVRNSDIIERHYRKIFLRNRNAPLEGRDRLPIEVIKRYVENVLEYDRTRCPFRYLASELPCQARVDITSGQGVFPVFLKGFIDRVDEKDGVVRIIDYKTGSEHRQFRGLDLLYNASESKGSDHVRQTLTYCLLYASDNTVNTQGQDFEPHIYYVRNTIQALDREIFLEKEKLHGYNAMRDGFLASLRGVLSEIFNPAIPFRAVPETRKCDNCPFVELCR